MRPNVRAKPLAGARRRLSEGLGRTSRRPVRGMVDPIIDWHVAQQERIDAFKTANVVAVFVRGRTALVVRVDATLPAEVVLCHAGVELVELQALLPSQDFDSRKLD